MQFTSTGRRQRPFSDHEFADRIFKAMDDQNHEVSYRYDHGGRLVERIGQLSLADHRSYGFRYEYDNDRVVRSFVTGPDGTIGQFDVRS
jgi:hypothetical protein